MKTVPVFCGKDCGGNACPLLLEIDGGRGVRLLHDPAGGGAIRDRTPPAGESVP